MRTQAQTQEQKKQKINPSILQDPKNSGSLTKVTEKVTPEVPVITGDYADVLIKISKVITDGDLSSLNDVQKLEYYNALCGSMGLNPLTRPFEYITLDGKLTLYARKDCTEQLRKIHQVSFEKIEHTREIDLYIVTAYARDKTGRTDSATGVIPFTQPWTIKGPWNPKKGPKGGYDWVKNPDSGKPVSPSEMAVLIMKTETKAKRRATLSICGLAILDESEIESIPLEKNITPLERPKPEDYKLEPVEPVTEELANKELYLAICDLSEKLQKESGYVEKVLKMKLGHADFSKIPKKFAQEWANNMQKRFDETQQFTKEMDGEGEAA